jgi:DNA polymerase-3 subunit alpha
MASVLSNNMNDIKQISFFMEECKRMGIPVLGPDVNESNYHFTVNKEGAIRFGLGAIKGLGSGPVEAIIEERGENGPFQSIFDMAKRINLRVCNKKAFESLAYAGGFDSFKNVHRAQYFQEDISGKTFLESAMRFGASFQDNESSSQVSLFGESSGAKMPEPEIPKATEWSSMFKLKKEKEVVGIFISGHPLDDFRVEIDAFCNGNISMLHDLESHKGKDILVPAIIIEAEHRVTKNGDPFGTLIIEDYSDSHKLFLWRENYLKFKHFFHPGTFVAFKGKIEKPLRRNELEFVVSTISLLQELKDAKASELSIKVSSKELDQVMITDLYKLFTENEGRVSVNFTVFDPLDGIEVRMPSKTIKIDPNSQLFKELQKFNLEFRLS